jgi:hypothetical protein
LAFGDAIADYSAAKTNGKNPLIDLSNGRFFQRTSTRSPVSAVGVKVTGEAGARKVAFVGLAPEAEHGIANLHMVGGNFSDALGVAKYQGVATGVEFLAVQPWRMEQDQYGSRWLPFARSIALAAQQKADVLDLDVYTPGSRTGEGLLSELLCRITDTTHTVPVVAAHNFGALPETVQSLAQSPCVLSIGASHTLASQKARNRGAGSPELKNDDDVMTALYSGRGFALNGLLKPDILAPAYGITAYGPQFIRFAGTSGATPTTAGTIALLKQAARLQGKELSLENVRYLFQGSSKAPSSGNERDGYGYLNLLEAWNLLQSLENLPPLAIEGHKSFVFQGKPTEKILNLTLTRKPLLGSVNTVVPMEFSIEYGPLSNGWLKFADPAQAELTDTLQKDLPLQGETQGLRLAFALTDEQWAALPAGEHVALVKGVRSDRKGKGREVDFVQPVSFVKGLEVEDDEFEIPALYADGIHRLSLASAPGDVFFLSIRAQCDGPLAGSSTVSRSVDNFEVVVGNEKDYAHASSVMNDYAPVVLGQTPLRVVSERNVLPLSIQRSLQDPCFGGKRGTLRVRRVSFATAPVQIHFQQGDSAEKEPEMRVISEWKLQGAPLVEGEFSRGALWKKNVSGTQVLLRQEFQKRSVSFEVPEGVEAVRIYTKKNSKQWGFLHIWDKEKDPEQTLESNLADASGLGAWGVHNEWGTLLLQASDLKKGQQVRVDMASEEKWQMVLVYTENKEILETIMVTSAEPFNSWKRQETSAFEFKLVPALKNLSMPSYFDKGTATAFAQVALTLEEVQENQTPTVAPLPLVLREEKLTLPLFF